MSHITRIPPIKLILDKDRFNILLDVLNYNEFNSKIEATIINAKKLKNKLLRYSIPREDENGNVYIDVRFYNNEISEVVFQFIEFNKGKDILVDYYSVLLKVREERKQENKNEE